jgi:DNA polymerase-4
MLYYTRDMEAILTTATVLFESVELENRSVRLLGIALSNLENVKQTQVIQLPLFEYGGRIL